ncbi:MAG: endolytic transglycosylase MltG [Aerococcus sp.]|nr:endolytic transglycosylase MltG [Aerococcus sp.]
MAKEPIEKPKQSKESNKRKQSVKPPKSQKRWGRLVGRIVAVVFVLALILGATFFYLGATGGMGDKKEVTIEIPEGTTQSQVADLLYKKGIVFNGVLFKLYLKTGSPLNVRSGNYEMTTSIGFPEAKEQLVENFSGDKATATVTIPEGTNVEGIADILAKQFKKDSKDVLKTMNDEDFLKRLEKKYPELLKDTMENKDVRYKLEGYLFPSTYTLTASDNVESTVEQMVSQMDVVREKYQDKIKQSKYSFHQILTLASLIESEASSAKDRRLISGVFYNRLNQDMPLQSDITVNYANKKHASYVTVDDTKIDSPYNLYQHTGLGPGPFASPGEDSIVATLNPTESDYLYFVADLKSGEVYYSNTYDEHMQKVDQYVSEEDAKLAESGSSSESSSGE